jgi:hypothetical protein
LDGLIGLGSAVVVGFGYVRKGARFIHEVFGHTSVHGRYFGIGYVMVMEMDTGVLMDGWW